VSVCYWGWWMKHKREMSRLLAICVVLQVSGAVPWCPTEDGHPHASTGEGKTWCWPEWSSLTSQHTWGECYGLLCLSLRLLLKPFVLETGEIRISECKKKDKVRNGERGKVGTFIHSFIHSFMFINPIDFMFILSFVLKKWWQWTSHVVWRRGGGCFGRRDT
jgi:hypothetical protein